MPSLEISRTSKIHLATLIPYALFMIFWGLGDSALQTDEGCDTFVTSTILKYGLPRHADELNHTMDYADVYGGLFVYRTWLPYYLQAASLAVLGKTTFAARLPFALCGAASIAALYFLAMRLTRDSGTAFLAAFFTASSATALLYFRIARYIPIPLLLIPFLLHYYLNLYENKTWSPSGFLITAFLFFQTMYVNLAGVLLGIGAHAFFYRQRIPRENLPRIFIAAGVILLFSLPWLAFISPVFAKITAYYVEGGEGVDTSLLGYPKRLAAFLFQTNNYIFPLILSPFIFFRAGEKPDPFHRNLCLTCIGGLMGVGTIHKVPLYQYIAGVIPLFHILLADIVVRLTRNRGALPLTAATGLLVFTNVVHVTPLLPVKWAVERGVLSFGESDYFRRATATFLREIEFSSKYLDHLHEITHPYTAPLDAAVEHFRRYGKAGDTVYIDNENDSFAFYTGAQMVPIKELDGRHPPRWIILRGDLTIALETGTGLTQNGERIREFVTGHNYAKTTLNTPPRHSNNSYEIQLHRFRQPAETGNIYILQLQNPDSPPEQPREQP